MKNKVKIR